MLFQIFVLPLQRNSKARNIMKYYKVDISTNTGTQLNQFLRKCQKADIAADKYAKRMGAVKYIQPMDVFAGGVDYLEFQCSKKGKEWIEVPSGDPSVTLWQPNCLAIPAIKTVPKGVDFELKWDEFIPGGIKRAKRLSLDDVKSLLGDDNVKKLREFEQANLGIGAYDYVPLHRFTHGSDKLILSPSEAQDNDKLSQSSRQRKPQWFRKAVEAEKLRLSLPVVEISEFYDIVKFQLPDDKKDAKSSEPISTPAFFIHDSYFWVSFLYPCTADDMEEISKETFEYVMNTAKRASKA